MRVTLEAKKPQLQWFLKDLKDESAELVDSVLLVTQWILADPSILTMTARASMAPCMRKMTATDMN